jgi:hypothetical protein
MLLVIPALALMSRPAVASPINLVADGSFESVPTGGYSTGAIGPWQLLRATGEAGVYSVLPFMYFGTNATDGNQAFDMGMGGFTTNNSLSQTLATVVGQNYRLTFDWGSEYDWGTSSTVSVGNLVAQLIDLPLNNVFEQVAGRLWLQHSASFEFIASGNDILTFKDLSTENGPGLFSHIAGLALDNISVVAIDGTVVPVPEPATLALVASGLALALKRRQKSRP